MATAKMVGGEEEEERGADGGGFAAVIIGDAAIRGESCRRASGVEKPAYI